MVNSNVCRVEAFQFHFPDTAGWVVLLDEGVGRTLFRLEDSPDGASGSGTPLKDFVCDSRSSCDAAGLAAASTASSVGRAEAPDTASLGSGAWANKTT